MAMDKTTGGAKTEEYVTPERVLMTSRTRFNPLRNLTPQKLSRQLDDFDAGYIADAALTWDRIEQRDDTIKSVAPKRKKAVSRHGYEVLMIDDSPTAVRHKEALEFFYNNLITEDATDRNFRGGFNLLVRQMMDAVGKMYANHEIVYRPTPSGLTATFRFVPLWFFENTTGRLRFLESVGSTFGVPLEPGEWLTTAADGLMKACSVAYMYKSLPLKDWLGYSERHGFPGVLGKTNAKRGTAEWNNMVEAVQAWAVDWAAVTNTDESIEGVNIETKGQLPFPKLVERMDRALAALWRGADLSTMSSQSGDGTGASLQGDEMALLEDDDAQMISDTLNTQVDRFVIRYTLGDTEPLAYIKLRTAQRSNVETDLKVDAALREMGVPMAVQDTAERYGRSLPDPDEELLPSATTTKPGGSGSDAPEPRADLANARLPGVTVRNQALAVAEDLSEASQEESLKARAKDLEDVRAKLEYILTIESGSFRTVALKNLQKDLPALLKSMNEDPAAAKVLEETMAAAVINAWTEAATERTIEEGAAA